MKKRFVLIVLVLALVGCVNNNSREEAALQDSCFRQSHTETWDDFERQKDSLWTVFNESNDDVEVDKAREMLYEMASQADWNMLAGKDYERRKSNVEIWFQQFVSAHPEQESLFCEEKERWENYHEAVLAVAELEDHGSSGTLYIIGTLEQSVDLWLSSFRNLWLLEQNQDIEFPEIVFTSRMIDDAYSAYIKQEDEDWYNAFSDNVKDGMEEHHKAIELEWQFWNDWMAFRKTVSKFLPKDIREIYDGCTNLTMRTKLHQLKNQNKGLGLINADMDRCLLSDSCTDKELLEYPGFNVAMEQYVIELFNADNK